MDLFVNKSWCNCSHAISPHKKGGGKISKHRNKKCCNIPMYFDPFPKVAETSIWLFC